MPDTTIYSYIHVNEDTPAPRVLGGKPGALNIAPTAYLFIPEGPAGVAYLDGLIYAAGRVRKDILAAMAAGQVA